VPAENTGEHFEANKNEDNRETFLQVMKTMQYVFQQKKERPQAQDGENIVIMGSGTVHKVVHPENSGFSHLFNTNVFFKDHQKLLWSSVSLSSKDKIVYHATVSPVQLF